MHLQGIVHSPWMLVLALPGLTILAIVVLGILFDKLFYLRMPPRARVLTRNLPLPPVNDAAIERLKSIKRDIEATLMDGLNDDMVAQYLKQIDRVLEDQSRESLLHLHALRMRLRRAAH